MNRMIRMALFAGTALAAVATGLPQDASAQSVNPGFFGSLSGWYYFNSGKDRTSYKNDTHYKGAFHPDDGWGGKAYLGYRFAGPLDVAVGAQGSWLSKGKGDFEYGPATTKAWYWAVDGEIGYNAMVGDLGVRLFGGVRYAEFKHRSKMIGYTDGSTTYFKNYDNDYWGIGPRIGTDFSTRLFGSNWSLFGDIAGSVLFGKLRGEHRYTDEASESGKTSQTVWNVEGQLGIGYEVAPGVTIGAGYRGEYWANVADKWFYAKDSFRGGHSDRFMHGPFVRVSYNFGPPPAMPAAAVVTPPPAPPKTANSFIVFFDFDKSNITAQAQKTINDAVAAAKAGNSARVTLTGHTDRSGSEQYNMALSLRRAEAVKANMIKQGIPASAIVVIGKGESQPLVPTADGVREPQNRRVEIVI